MEPGCGTYNNSGVKKIGISNLGNTYNDLTCSVAEKLTSVCTKCFITVEYQFRSQDL